jgi:hypothetical protein
VGHLLNGIPGGSYTVSLGQVSMMVTVAQCRQAEVELH